MADCNFIYLMKSFPLKWLHGYFFLSLIVFGGVQLLKYFSISAPDWIFFYLNDFLTIPIVATVCLHVVWFLKRDQSIRLNPFTIASLVILYSIYFEVYLPSVSTRYTADVWDVFWYSIGGIVFWLLQKLE